MRQGRSHQLSGGAVDIITIGVARKAPSSSGAWGRTPQEIFAFVPSEIASDAILGNIARL